jgi:hypothetical protein
MSVQLAAGVFVIVVRPENRHSNAARAEPDVSPVIVHEGFAVDPVLTLFDPATLTI